MSGESQTPSAPKKRLHKRIGILFTVIIVVLAAAVAAAYFLGWVYAGVKTPSQAAVLQPTVCDTSVVTKYNEILSSEAFTTGEDGPNTSSLRSLADEVKAKNGADKDPTCQYIIFSAAFYENKADEAQAAYAKVKELNEASIYVNNTIQTIVSIEQMKARVEGMTADVPLGSG